jgi:replicative DNA helicase
MIISEIKNLQIEQSVLATLMTVANSYSEVESKLSEEDFFANRHKLIFKAIVDLDSKNSPYDVVLVNQYLENHNLSEQSGADQTQNVVRFLVHMADTADVAIFLGSIN